MKKWLMIIAGVILTAALIGWFSLDKHLRVLILNPPKNENVLFWSTEQRDAGFRLIDQLDMLPKATIKAADSSVALPQGQPLTLDASWLDEAMQTQRIAGLVVLQNGEMRLERYGLDFSAEDKWTSFSVAKSFTSTLVGAALKDGFISSLDDPVSQYITEMQGSNYDDVTIAQLLTMTSGIQWNEDYADPNSDVSKFNFHQPEPGMDVTASYMRTLARAHPPGTTYWYSTGETNLIGLLVSRATQQPLASYLSEKIWSKLGAEHDASWVLGPTGHEISGCCIQASTRDFARFGQFILNGAKVNGESIVPADWFSKATTAQVNTNLAEFAYGYQWWVKADGSFQGRGIFGQGIFIDPARNLVIAVNGNWPVASHRDWVAQRQALYRTIQQAIDNEQGR